MNVTQNQDEDDLDIDLSSWDGGKSRDNWWWTEQSLGLEELFHEVDDWEDIYIGLIDMFDEKIVDQQDLDIKLDMRRANQLYSIFNMSVATMKPTKRKVSPDGPGFNHKARRMSIDQTASPKLRPGTGEIIQRVRAATISSPSSLKRVKRTAARKLLPGQKLLPGIWGKPDPKQ